MNRLVIIAVVALGACSDPGGGGGGVIVPDGVVFGDAGALPDGVTDTAGSTDTIAPNDGTGVGDTGGPSDGTTPSDGTSPVDTVAPSDVSGSCTPGDVRCDGTTVARCRADGSGWEPVQACAEGQVCADGQCLACYPSARRCSPAGASEECDHQGQWATRQDCSAEGLTCVAGSCVSPCSSDPKNNSNSGCDYWAVDMDNHWGAQNGPYAVIVSNLSAQTARVTVTKKDGAGAQATEVVRREVAPGELSIFELANRNMGGAGTFWTAYRIESNVPIIAYQFNPLDNVDVFSNDASLLLPSNTFGKEYFVMSRFEILGGGPVGDLLPYRGEISIVAAAAQTNVTIVPTARTQAGANMATMMPGQRYTYALEPYQVLNIKSDQDGGDLTGTLVTADKPVGVFGGHEAAVSGTVCCADHLEHQMFPVSTWGTTYVATKSKARMAEVDYWRVIASQDGTTVTFSPAVSAPRTLGRGQWIEVATAQDFVVSADKPISVGQLLASSQEIVVPAPYSDCTASGVCAPGYTCEMADIFGLTSNCFPPMCLPGGNTCPSGHVCTTYDDGSAACTPVGDPTLIMLPPEKQFRKDYVFLSPNKYAQDYINIVAPEAAQVTLDGVMVPAGNFTMVSGSTWKVARVAVSDGVHKVVANMPVSVIAYGYDRDVSYGYAAGLNLVED